MKPGIQYLTQISVFSAVALLILLGNSCVKTEPVYSVIPQLTWEKYSVEDLDTGWRIHLFMSFTDGDGDLGAASDSDKSSNLFIDYYEMIKISGDTAPHFSKIWLSYPNANPEDSQNRNFNRQIPNLRSTSKPKPIKGEIETIIGGNGTPFKPKATGIVKFRLYIVDRANNKSNVIETPVIKL